MIMGQKISEIDIWKKPGSREPHSFYRERLSSSHADPTADTAIANVMEEERILRKRELMKAIEEERERRQILKEKKKDAAIRARRADRMAEQAQAVRDETAPVTVATQNAPANAEADGVNKETKAALPDKSRKKKPLKFNPRKAVYVEARETAETNSGDIRSGEIHSEEGTDA